MLMFVLLAAVSAAWCAAGWALCRATHRQRGIDVDRLWITLDPWKVPAGRP